MIAFYDGKTEKLIGTVKLVDGKLVGSVPSLAGFNGSDPGLFFEQFTDFDNGYGFTQEIPDDQEAPEQAKVERSPAETFTAKQVKERYS